MRRILQFAFIIAVSGFLTGCIAGAGQDWKSDVRESENYPAYVAPFVHETMVRGCGKSESGKPLETTDSPRFIYPEVSATAIPIALGNAVASYRNNRFEVKVDGSPLISEKLPAVFYMHPLKMGIYSVGGREIIVIMDRSRATTGLTFFGIYGVDGVPYYKRVLAVREGWDIRATTDRIEIVGSCNVRRLRFDDSTQP